MKVQVLSSAPTHMIRIDFAKPLSALEIREPALVVCRQTAEKFELKARLEQPQQQAFTGHSRASKRQRIGNGKHKDWYVHFQPEELNCNRPTTVGTIAIKSATIPEIKQYGGFDYGKFGEENPTYTHITVQTATELKKWHAVDPEPKLLSMVYEGLVSCFDDGQDRLFSPAPYTLGS